MGAQPERTSGEVLRAALDGLDQIHAAWLDGWHHGYAEGRKAQVEEMAQALLHEQATIAAGVAVDTARRRHGEPWAAAIRDQAEGD